VAASLTKSIILMQSHSSRRILGALLFLIVQTVAAQTQSPDSALQQILSSLEGTPLGLQEAISLGLQNSNELKTAEAVYLAAEGAARRENGTFDPEVFFNFYHDDQDQPTASFFAGAPVLNTEQTTGSGGLRFELPIGTQVEASMNAIRLETNSGFAFLNPQYSSFGNLSLRQPLLGGFDVSARKEASKAGREMDAAKARYDQAALAVNADVEQQYWDLYAAERTYAVQKLTRDRAEAFLREAELRVSSGLIGPNQVANARTFLAQQEILLIDSEELLDRVSDHLAAVIDKKPEPRFRTTEGPPSIFPIEDMDALVEAAIEKNLQLASFQSEIEAIRALSDAAFWEAFPTLDVVGSIGGNGLSGTPRDVIFGSDTLRTNRSGSLGDALEQSVKRFFPTWSLGMELTIPVTFREGLGEKQRLDASVVIAEQRYVQAKQRLMEEVRARSRELANGERRLKAAREGVDAAQEQVRIGQIEFQNGRTTAFELVRLGEDFAVAQHRYSQALVRSAKAAAELRLLTSGAYPFQK